MIKQTLNPDFVGPDLTLRHENPYSVAEFPFSGAGFKYKQELNTNEGNL
jgi:hypothetical protein